MKEIEKGSAQHLIIQIIIIIIAGLIIFPLLDFIISLIFKTEFAYSIDDHIVEPIFYGIVLGIVMWALDKKSVNKAKK